jgi:hypothetical protein
VVEWVAGKALEKLTTATGFVPQMLSLCALDAQAQGSKELGFRALKEIIRQYGSMTKEAQQEIRLPVLCRYTPHPPHLLI